MTTTTTTADSSGTNYNCLQGMRCPNPECKSEGPFNIEAVVMVMVTDDGTEDQGSDYEWRDDAFCQCIACGSNGTVYDFTIGNQLKMNPFSVLLAYPQDNSQVETYFAHEWARTSLEAVELAKKTAAEAASNKGSYEPDDFQPLLVIRGFHDAKLAYQNDNTEEQQPQSSDGDNESEGGKGIYIGLARGQQCGSDTAGEREDSNSLQEK